MTDRLFRPIRIPRSLALAALLVSGIRLADALSLSAEGPLLVSALLLGLCWRSHRRHQLTLEHWLIVLSTVAIGAVIWSVRSSGNDHRDIAVLMTEESPAPGSVVRLQGTVVNIPALDTPFSGWIRPVDSDSAESQASQSRWKKRTLFLVDAENLVNGETSLPIQGRCRIMVDGDVADRVHWGDRVELLGQIDIADPPANPGEFDYAKLLERNRISAIMFLKYPAAVTVKHSASWHPARWLSVVRQETVATLKRCLSVQNQATAEAMLLGNRGHLAPDAERDFVSSGTMHLLAISGLHVGILYVFLIRLCNLLIVSRHHALLIAGTICVLYCLLTDMRPSVSRATLFIVLHIGGQFMYRDIRIGSLIGTTALILIIIDPAIAFDLGAWLSFLAVGALGWVSDRTASPEPQPAPPDEISWRDRITGFRDGLKRRLGRGYRQMLAVTLLAMPLVASQFHVVSLTGIVINVFLIPYTAVTLIAGYVFIFIGLLIPPLAGLPGSVFDLLLSGLNATIQSAADMRMGFITIQDLPNWFLPSYYSLLAVSAISSVSRIRQSCRLLLLTVVVVVFFRISLLPKSNGLICTVLAVGHGNAVIVETPDSRVFLFDAGALNRAERTADIVRRYLWHRGYRMIDAIVISHPDADHYNAVGSLLDRMPVGQVLMSKEFAQADIPEINSVLQTIQSRSIPATIVTHGDRMELGSLSMDFYQAQNDDSTRPNDNASSVVCVLNCFGKRICLPGDLEGYGQTDLLPVLPECDLLVSPHHGSPGSNNTELANAIKPKAVFVSSRKISMKDKLDAIFAPSKTYYTVLSGALTYHIEPNGLTKIRQYRGISQP